MLWRNIFLWKLGCTEDTVVGNMVEKDATKTQVSIAPNSLIRTKYLYCHGCSRISSETRTCFLEHQHYMSPFFSLFLCLSPFHTLLYLLNLFCACFIPISLITPCIVFVYCLNKCYDSSFIQLSCTGHLHAYDRQLNKGMIWWTKQIPIAY